LLITLLNFALLYWGVGDPLAALQFRSGEHLDLGQEQVLRQQYGLDKSFSQQYISWLIKITQGDWGVSYLEGRPVLQLIGERIPATLLLTGTAFTLGIILALGLGVLAALQKDTWIDQLINLTNFFFLSIPTFLFSLLLLQVFSLSLDWLPSGGMSPLGQPFTIINSWTYLILPTSILAIYYATDLIGFIRKQMINVLRQDYIRTAYASGLEPRLIILTYALKNTLLPVLTLVGMSLPRFFGGAFIIEYIFAWPGMGRLVIDSAFQRDYPVLLAQVLIMSILVLLSNVLADLLCYWADPRIRLPGSKGGKA